MESWKENLRWDIDLSLRGTVDGEGEAAFLGALGLDLHKIVRRGDGRDLATLVFQPYLLRGDTTSSNPPIFEDEHDFALQWRISNVNLNLRGDGTLNVRAGHFEIPFGLEQNLDTNGTLRRTPHQANFGFVADWGLTLNGALEHLDYEIAWSRGSGNEYQDPGGDGVLSGRIGTPVEDDLTLGLSMVHGDIASGDSTRSISRVAADATTYWRSLGFQAELSHGDDSDQVRSTRALLEVNSTNRHETTLGWVQLIGTNNEPKATASGVVDGTLFEARLGALWRFSRRVTFSAQLTQPLGGNSSDREPSVALQLRCRF